MNWFLERLYLIMKNAIGCISDNLSNRLKEKVLFVASFVFALIGIIRYCNDRIQSLIFYEGSIVRAISVIMFFFILVSVTETKSFKKRVNLLFWVGWMLCFVLMFILSFVHPVKKDYFLWSILSLSVIPMIMISTSQNERWLKCTIIIARSFVLVAFAFFGLSMLVTPFITKEASFAEFVGICNNPNNNGLVCTSFFTSALYLLFADRKNKFIYSLCMGFCIAITIITRCRTAQTAIIIETCIAALFYCKYRELYKIDVKWRNIVLGLLAVILISFSFGYTLNRLDSVDLNAHAMTEYEEAYEWVHSDDLRAKIDDASSGRLLLWRAYSQHLTPFGNGRLYGPLMPELEASKWAHNNALDIGYVSGYIAMFGYIIWLLAVTIFIATCLFKKRGYRKEYLFGILSFVGYFVQAMLEITIYPMSNGVAFLCFITLGSAAFNMEEKKNHNDG